MVAVSESEEPPALDTRTQKRVVFVTAGVVYLSSLAPAIGDDVWPLDPANQRYARDPGPVAFTVSVTPVPALTVWLFGCDVIDGA